MKTILEIAFIDIAIVFSTNETFQMFYPENILHCTFATPTACDPL